MLGKILVALLYLAAGAYLLTHPALGVAGFTLALAIFLCAEGVADVVAYFSTRKAGGSSLWMLVDGIITLALGFMIWNQWPVAIAMGHWNTGRHQHGHDRHYPPHDDLGSS